MAETTFPTDFEQDLGATGAVLRRFSHHDLPSLVRRINNRLVYQTTLRIPYPYNQADGMVWLSHVTMEYINLTHPLNLALALKKADNTPGEVIGGIGFSNISRHTAEIGYWLSDEFWGRGITTEAVRVMTEYGFSTLKLHEIEAHVFDVNAASFRVLEKNGYVRTEHLPHNVVKDGRFVDEWRMLKTAPKKS